METQRLSCLQTVHQVPFGVIPAFTYVALIHREISSW